MTYLFDGANLRLARCAQSLSLADVGEATGKSKQFIQRIESGTDTPTEELVALLASVLNVEHEFFFAGAPQALPEDAFHFRKLMRTTQTDKQMAIAKGELFRRLVSLVDSKLRLPKFDFPAYAITTPEEAERAAEQCRAHWSLGAGPINSMVRVMENAGAMVTTFEGTAKEIDALSIVSSRPIVVTNSLEASACRVRFGHAHEVGHFVGHVGKQTGDKASEAEANRFAGAFFMPRSTFAKEFPALRGGTQINWLALAELKMRWRVSKAAMLYRARQLSLLSEEQYKKAIIGHLFSKGQRHEEKEDPLIPHEQPELLWSAITLLRDKLGMSIDDIATAVKMRTPLLFSVAPQLRALTESEMSPAPSSASVISLSRFRETRGGAL
jgi:Zn-dependent peptidase ImmA (M78 family)/transcriptional regulator with XRE-family HTH domain